MDSNWREKSREASFWHLNTENGKVQCELCPRNCELDNNKMGFCLVRGNVDNKMHTFNYGISVQATIECIETEAVNHYMPGARILSMGNVGCMMACTYCQNWQTSQVKHLNDKNVREYSPEDVINLALENNINVISWTYNDPVVWQEFVVDTSRLAKKNGIKTLYKSALYIEEKPLADLIEVIDIFSISLKCMDPKMYVKYTKGKLEPVLKAIKQIAATNRHLEISQLVVTDLNDDGSDARKTAKWMRENLNENVPLHLVAYHPAYRYTKERTSIDKLLELRQIVLEEGIKYCYLGNVYAENMSNTSCKNCGHRQVERFGLTVNVCGLDDEGKCSNCGTQSPIREALKGISSKFTAPDFKGFQEFSLDWNREVNSIHISIDDKHEDLILKIERNPGNKIEMIKVRKGLERIIISKSFSEEINVKISCNLDCEIEYLAVLDRAHFPVSNKSKASNKYLN